jgi:plastocyanin
VGLPPVTPRDCPASFSRLTRLFGSRNRHGRVGVCARTSTVLCYMGRRGFERYGDVMRSDRCLALLEASEPLNPSFCRRKARSSRRALAMALVTTFLASAVLTCPVSPAQAAGPFDELAGAWTGSGVVNLREGSKERVRCKANYVVKSNGYSIDQELTCASDAYKFEMNSNIVQQGDELTGIWFESVHRVAGRVVGRSNGSQIEVRAEGDTFTALLNVSTHGDKQSLVMESPGSKVESVTIALTRAK